VDREAVTLLATRWQISSCQPRKLLLHNKKEWGSYGQASNRSIWLSSTRPFRNAMSKL
jgi:hypothetical protein